METVPGLSPEIEYPEEGETVVAPTYSFRVGAPVETDEVEVSIDGGPWQECRRSSDYWWCAWAEYRNGKHQVVARIRGEGERFFYSAPREFAVDVG